MEFCYDNLFFLVIQGSIITRSLIWGPESNDTNAPNFAKCNDRDSSECDSDGQRGSGKAWASTLEPFVTGDKVRLGTMKWCKKGLPEALPKYHWNKVNEYTIIINFTRYRLQLSLCYRNFNSADVLKMVTTLAKRNAGTANRRRTETRGDIWSLLHTAHPRHTRCLACSFVVNCSSVRCFILQKH